MDMSSDLSSASRGRDSDSVSTPGLNEYLLTHKPRGVPHLGRLELADCIRLILFNVQGFTTKQIWTELRASLGDLARAIVKVKLVNGPNRNPHADLWVRRELGGTLVSVIRQQTRTRLWTFMKVVTEAERREGSTFATANRSGDETRFATVTHWRLAIWQPWRERRLTPADMTPINRLRPNLTSVATWNINGFWRKLKEIENFVDSEKVAVLALQETLVSACHYSIRMKGYRCFWSNAEEDFRGIATLVDETLAVYQVPHDENWLVHVKVFGYAGWSGPTHFINVYLKSGGNHRRERGKALAHVVGIIDNALRRDSEARFMILGDFNESGDQIFRHLNVGGRASPLTIAPVVGSDITRFPIRGQPRSLDHILINKTCARLFRCARVLRNYTSSDHRPVKILPRKKLPSARVEAPRACYDNKMIRLKGDFVVNDNSWRKLMTTAYGNDFDRDYEGDVGDLKELVSNQQLQFSKAFDSVCRKHSVKKEHQPVVRQQYPRKLRNLIRTVARYKAQCLRTKGMNKLPKEIDLVKLARAQKRFKKLKREWEIRQKQKFYSQVADDFAAHDHKNVWNRLDSQVRPEGMKSILNPVKDKEGVIHYRAEEIMAVMREHYKDLLTYDPQGVSQNYAHWDSFDLGDGRPELIGLNNGLRWPEILVTIRDSNRNTAPGKDGVHVNVLKCMVLEECMAAVKAKDPSFQRPDNVRLDLPRNKLPETPMTPMGKAFFSLLNSVWQTGVVPVQWSEAQIVNLFKGGDPENTNNYRGISLISCAFKVLISLMASRLTTATQEAGVISKEQAGFRKREEAVAQATALAEIVRRRWIDGKPTFGAFIDFKKAYDRVYHGLLFRILDHIGVRGRFLRLVKTMYEETRYEVRVGDHISASFSPTRGAKQGDPLSPILFIIYINTCLDETSVRGVRPSTNLSRCRGLMYADDVVCLESRLEDVQTALDCIVDWGKKYGMELGRDKCGIMMWYGRNERRLRARVDVLDVDSEASSVVGNDDWGDNTMLDLEFQHDHMIYLTEDGVIPSVKQYKYLGINVDKRLGDPRKVIPGERSMELEFAHFQAKKGMRIIHALRPFLTDAFCPIVLKVAMVRNLVYSKMLFGAELIGFQALHAEPMQRVINVAAKWIIGLQHTNTQCDSMTLCYELGLPPIHVEMCALRARLAFKLEAHTDGGLNTWLQTLYDRPSPPRGNFQTWVSLTKKWLEGIRGDLKKYARSLELSGVVEGQLRLTYDVDAVAPLRPWVQIGHALEMRNRSNRYSSSTMRGLRTAFLGETEFGSPDIPMTGDYIIRPTWGELVDAEWDVIRERAAMDEGRNAPQGRTRGEVIKTAYVRDVILERLLSANRSKGFNRFYDVFHLGVTRGYLREAALRPDLAEGVRWLSMARTRCFPTVEGAWQRIKRSGKDPPFKREFCPLCKCAIKQGWEWAHLLVRCESVQVRLARIDFLAQSIAYISNNLRNRGDEDYRYADDLGMEDRIYHNEAVSIYLIGGLYRKPGLPDQEGWFDAYFLGFGATRLITPGFESFGYVYVTQFLQRIAPVYVARLGESLRSDGLGIDEESVAGSEGSPVNQHSAWWTEGADPEPLVGYLGNPLPADYE
jgi:exonuclease III